MAKTVCIENADWAVVWDEESGRHAYARNVDIRFEGDTITGVGGSSGGPADEVIDGRGRLVAPGFVNVHSHPAGELAYRGVREEHGVPAMYMSGLYERMQAFELDLDGQRACALASYAELLLSGVTTLIDISSPYEGWLEGFGESGLRGYLAPSFASARHVMRVPHLIEYDWDEQAGRREFERCCELMDRAEAHPSGRLGALVSPSTIDSVSRELLDESVKLSESAGRVLTIHIAESVLEFKNMVTREGMTPVQWAADIGLLGGRTLLGHALFLDEHSFVHWFSHRDLGLIAESGASVAHCPTPFSRYGQILEHFGRYVTAGVNMGIGTDTLPCNMVEEVRSATVLGRIAASDIKATSLADVYHAATVGGANALGRRDIGRIAPGAKADLVLVDLTHPSMRPVRDPLRSWVFSAAERAVRDVYVGGTRVVADAQVRTIDVGSALGQLQAAQERMLASSPRNDFKGREAEEIAPLTLSVTG